MWVLSIVLIVQYACEASIIIWQHSTTMVHPSTVFATAMLLTSTCKEIYTRMSIIVQDVATSVRDHRFTGCAGRMQWLKL